MKVDVDMSICLLHGQCVIAAPQVFSFDDDGGLVWVAEVDEAQRADVEAAADACPEQAILLG
ncbi:ferredoxin [Rhodobacter sp. 140A]|uniref:Ferredoxin n=1 Tax=Paenirhodobacter ferrireducens TaxID=1215032 RepID=A0A443LP82_9RHOB|nr:ferredoxin [Sinirhodobacter ferrireducens]RBP94259.1 ferredoxin [Rhodobacter sp. 140A]RWR50974.1 ferredoxin [Sinirhodobacter ferrireducens]